MDMPCLAARGALSPPFRLPDAALALCDSGWLCDHDRPHPGSLQ